MPYQKKLRFKFGEVSEATVKALYDQSPAINRKMTWEEVKACDPMYRVLCIEAANTGRGMTTPSAPRS